MGKKDYPCAACGGSGMSRLAPSAICDRCGGSGKDPYAMR
jgi:DnaJ-class molecular chaperone